MNAVSGYTGPVTRRNRGRSHSYVDANGRPVPGVTTLLSKGLPKPALTNWAAGAAADYAVDHWDTLAALDPSERIKRIKAAPNAARDAAALRGTQLHRLADRLVADGSLPADAVSDAQRPLVDSYVRFLTDWRPDVLATEAACWNLCHGYAGTFDMLATLNGQTWLLDIKTSKGVYGSYAYQVAAYAHAEWWDDGTGPEPMPPVDRAGAVHVRADGYDLIELDISPETFRAFLYIVQVAHAADTEHDLVHPPLDPPGRTV